MSEAARGTTAKGERQARGPREIGSRRSNAGLTGGLTSGLTGGQGPLGRWHRCGRR